MTEDIRRTRTCERCKKAIPLDQVRYYPKGRDVYMLVCESCREDLKNISKGDLKNLNTRAEPALMKPKTPKILDSVPAPEQRTTLKTVASSSDGLQKTMYNCSRCDYNFKVDEYSLRSSKAQCPYCGKSDKTKRQ